MEKFVLLCIFLVGTFLKLSNGQVTCNNKDPDFRCGKWKQSGFCTHSHVEYMRKNCMKSCGTCANPNPAVTCNNKDGDRNCNIWTNLGFCEGVHEAYMEKNCMKSCKQCVTATATTTTTITTPITTKAPVCGKLPAKQCRAGEVCSNPDTPSAKCGAPVCGKPPATVCAAGQVCRNPDTPCAKCEAPVCGKLPAKQCKPLKVCSNPDTPSAKCGAAVCGRRPAKQCTTNFERCVNPDTPTAKCEFKCGPTQLVCSEAANSRTPICLDAAGNTPTFFTFAAATCKCTTTSCLTFNSLSTQTSTTPVCGTAANGALLTPFIGVGVCQGCRMGNDGRLGVGTAQNGAGSPGLAPLRANSTCPAPLGCCVGGACVAKLCPPPFG